MTYNQMVTFKERLEVFLKTTRSRDHSDPTDAAEILRTQFGDDFPVPPKSTTGKSLCSTCDSKLRIRIELM